MKYSAVYLLIALFSSSCSSTKKYSSPTEEVKVLEDQWMLALREKDTAFLNKILLPTFVLNGTNQHPESKQQYLETSAMQERSLDSPILNNREIKVYPETVISMGNTIYSGIWKGNNFNLRVRYTNIFIRFNNQWKVAAAHLSILN